jgi:hypothetical protein
MKFIQKKQNNNTCYNSRYRENFDDSNNNGSNAGSNAGSNQVVLGVITISNANMAVGDSNPACMSYAAKQGPGFIGVL